jgi:hypothetical protein
MSINKCNSPMAQTVPKEAERENQIIKTSAFKRNMSILMGNKAGVVIHKCEMKAP